LPQLKS